MPNRYYNKLPLNNQDFLRFQMQLSEMLHEISWRGARIDVSGYNNQMKYLGASVVLLTEELQKLTWENFNPDSPKQVADLLYNKLRLPAQAHRKTKAVTTNEEALKKLRKKYPNIPILGKLLEYRELNKKFTTYSKLEFNSPVSDDRIYSLYSTTGTVSGRLVAKKHLLKKNTFAAQVVPPWFRKLIIPNKYHDLIVTVDLVQAEAMIVAWLAQEDLLMLWFDQRKDVYREMASRYYGYPPEDATEDARQLFKKITHATNYGMGPRLFATLVGTSEAQAKMFYTWYHGQFKKIKEWHRKLELSFQNNPMFVTPMGRRRVVLGRPGPDLWNSIYSYIPQSTCVDYANLGLVRLGAATTKLPIIQNHDELVYTTDKKHLDSLITNIKLAFSVPVWINHVKLLIPIKISAGPTWGDQKLVEVFYGYGG